VAEERPGARVIAGGAADEAVEHPSTLTDDELAALLPAVALRPALLEALPGSAAEVQHPAQGQRPKDPPPQASGAERLQGRVGEDRHRGRELEVLGEVPGMRGRAAAHDRDPRALLLELGCVLPNLGGFLAAERSAKVAEKHQYRRAILPQIAEPGGVPVDVLHDGVGQFHHVSDAGRGRRAQSLSGLNDCCMATS
jgi:hypothetical protein